MSRVSDVYGANSFNGLALLAGAALASLLGLLAAVGLALAAMFRRQDASRRRARVVLRLALANSVAAGLLFWAMEAFDLFGPRLPAWIDWLGPAWLVAFAAVSAMMLRTASPPCPREWNR